MAAAEPCLRIEGRTGPAGWNTYLIPYAQPLPVPEGSRWQLRCFLSTFVPQVRKTLVGLELMGLMQYNQLNLGGAAGILSAKAHAWGVDWGLGYWPERTPPTLWTADDFSNLGIGEMPRPMMHQVFGITKGDDAVMEAATTMIGLGPVILTLCEGGPAAVKAKAREQFHPLIQEPALKNFAYYFPLLCADTLAETNAERLPSWTCGIAFYLRESPEEEGVFIASKCPLAGTLEAIGAKAESGGIWTWVAPAAP